MINTAVIGGRLTRDPELRYTQNGTAVLSATVAVDRGMSKEKKAEAEAKGQQTADFINITAWSKTAEFIANYFKKGDRILVQGNIRTGQYQNNEGQTIYTTDVNAYSVEKLDWDNSGARKEDDFKDIEGFHPTTTDDIPF